MLLFSFKGITFKIWRTDQLQLWPAMGQYQPFIPPHSINTLTISFLLILLQTPSSNSTIFTALKMEARCSPEMLVSTHTSTLQCYKADQHRQALHNIRTSNVIILGLLSIKQDGVCSLHFTQRTI